MTRIVAIGAILAPLGLVAGIIGALPASAADLPSAPLLDNFSQPPVVELGSGWYLRGDVTYAKTNDRDVKMSGSVLNSPVRFSHARLDDSWQAGGGFGYKFLNWLRADVTVDYRFPTTFRDVANFPGGTVSYDNTRIGGFTGLVNGYVDLGTWSGISPYVGAGIGVSNIKTDHFWSSPYTGGLPGPGVMLQGKSDYSLAWALMGGVAFSVADGMLIDLGYRYMNVRDAKLVDDGTNNVRLKDLSSHEVRVGFRYMID